MKKCVSAHLVQRRCMLAGVITSVGQMEGRGCHFKLCEYVRIEP